MKMFAACTRKTCAPALRAVEPFYCKLLAVTATRGVVLETPECLRVVAQVRRYRRDVGSFDGRPVSRWNGAEAEQRAVFVDESTCGLLALFDNLEWAPPNTCDEISHSRGPAGASAA